MMNRVQDFEKFVYVLVTNTGNGSNEPDYLAVVESNPESDYFNTMIHKMEMHYVNDEIHRISPYYSSFTSASNQKKFTNLIIPGLASSRIYFVETNNDFSNPEIAAVIEPESLIKETRYSAPNKVLQVSEDILLISMIGSENKDSSGGFAVIDAKTLDVLGRWESEKNITTFNYDFSLNSSNTELISSDLCTPRILNGPIKIQDLIDKKYGTKIHFWDFQTRELIESIDLGIDGLLPLNVQWFNDSENHGLITTALLGNIWHFFKDNDQWKAEKIAGKFEPLEIQEFHNFPLALATSHLISLDNRFLFVAEWLRGRIIQYDISEIENTRLIGELKIPSLDSGIQVHYPFSGPSMMNLSSDGARLYVSSSFVNSWDKQFFSNQGSWVLRMNFDSVSGGLELDTSFHMDFFPGKSRDIFLP